jgi:hypothetical protein
MLINLGSLWLQRSRQGTIGFYLAATGAFLIFILGIGFELTYASAAGVMLTIAGSLLSVFASENRNRPPLLVDHSFSAPPTGTKSQSHAS